VTHDRDRKHFEFRSILRLMHSPSWQAPAAVLVLLATGGSAAFLACSSDSKGGQSVDPSCPECTTPGTLPDGGAFPPSGTLDTSFAGGKGSVLLKHPDGSTNQVFGRIGVMRDGSLVIGMPSPGATQGSSGITLGRYTADGLPFPKFGTGTNGAVTLDLPGYPSDFAITADDSIVVVGDLAKPAGGGSVRDYVTRFHADGTLDTSFGEAGRASFELGAPGTDSYATSVVPQPDGALLVIGAVAGPAVVRLDASGHVDTAFGKKTPPGAVFYANGKVVLEPAADGSFVFADNMAIVHVASSTGEPNPAFGAPIALEAAYEHESALAPFTGAGITAGWVSTEDGGATARAVHREPGQPDRTFAADAGPSGPYAASTLLVIGGKVLVGGGASYRTGSSEVWASELLPDGGADPAFAANALGDGGPGSLARGQILYVDALRNDPSGRVLVAGLSAGYKGVALARIFP
jgi:uncharacterized delta-60 repeat protein